MKKYVAFLFILTGCASVALGQSPDLENSSRWSAEVNGGLMHGGLYQRPVELILCIEGCTTLRQTPFRTAEWTVSAGYRLNDRHRMMLAISSGSYKFENELQDGFGGGTFTYDVVHRYTGFSLHHHLAFLRTRQSDFFIRNGLQYDLNKSDEITFINRHGLTYTGYLGLEVHILEKTDLILAGHFRSALLRMNRDFTGDWDKSYKPYAYGLVIGIRRDL